MTIDYLEYLGIYKHMSAAPRNQRGMTTFTRCLTGSIVSYIQMACLRAMSFWFLSSLHRAQDPGYIRPACSLCPSQLSSNRLESSSGGGSEELIFKI